MLRSIFLVTIIAVLLNLNGCVSIKAGNKAFVMGSSISRETGFINKKLDDYRYAVYVPQDYTSAKEWPLIVFLHGAGERGEDGLAQTDVGIGHAIRMHPERFPAIVLMPQCPSGKFWNSITEELQSTLKRTMFEYSIDQSRVYLTGLSMGGYGTWLWGGIEPERFAALMPICGGGELPERLLDEDTPNPYGALETRVHRLAKVPIWAFHGADDPTVPVERSREMVQLVRDAGGSVRYTEFPDTGHNSWDQAYDQRDAIRWLFDQSK